MRTRVIVQDQSSIGRAIGEVALEDVPTAMTLRDLVRTRVREEVARHNASPAPVFRGLVTPEGADVKPEGAVVPAGRFIDWERQADLAEEAFGRNGFLVLIDGRQVVDLDEQLALTADSDIRFIRLVALVGG